jgi:hypothetical protein
VTTIRIHSYRMSKPSFFKSCSRNSMPQNRGSCILPKHERTLHEHALIAAGSSYLQGAAGHLIPNSGNMSTRSGEDSFRARSLFVRPPNRVPFFAKPKGRRSLPPFSEVQFGKSHIVRRRPRPDMAQNRPCESHIAPAGK